LAIIKIQQYEAAIEIKVVQNAVRSEKIMGQFANEFYLHPNEVRKWK